VNPSKLEELTVEIDDGGLQGDTPKLFIAATQSRYWVAGSTKEPSKVMEVSGGLPTVPSQVCSKVDRCQASSQLNSIKVYLTIGEPLLDGAFQEYRSDGGANDANVLIGAFGCLGDVPGLEIKNGDSRPSPTEFTADICTSYFSPGIKPIKEQSVAKA
jgi:hypothetical protein